MSETAAAAVNAGLTAGRVGARQAAAALAATLAHTPGLADRARALAGELAAAAAGRTVATPAKGDSRFADPAWRENPLYRRAGQAYLATEQAITRAVEEADVDWRTAERARFAASVVTSAMAPTNTLPGNPAALKHVLVPWRAAYQTTRLFGGDATFVLSGGGHIQHLVNPPGNPRAWYRTGPLPGADPGAWLADTTVHQGSWWAHWSRWVQARSGAQRRAPATPGGGRFGQLDQAPGRYVRQK